MSELAEVGQEVDEDTETGGDSKNDNMCSFLKYMNDWKKFSQPEYCKEIHENSLHGELRSSSFRSVCWQILLNIFSYPNQEKDREGEVTEPDTTDTEDSSSCVKSWSAHATQCREEYSQLKASLALDPTLSRVDNPLSQNEESVWYKHFCDTELKAVIHQDVVRTFPSLDFFRNNEHIQDLMVSILFVYARKYPHMCYRQGMHEILAPIIFVLHCDHQALLHALEVSSVDEHLMNILNEQFLEHDAFAIFCKVMASIETYYLINDSTPTSSGYFPPSATKTTFSCITDNHVVSQLYYINEHILKPADPALHAQLYNLKIPLTLFGIRWLRLLFGREFSLQDLLVLWDVIFAEGSSRSENMQTFDLVNYVVVAMLVAIRDQILESDHIECLSYLMRYPPGLDISTIIDHALHLKYPHLYPDFEPIAQQVTAIPPGPEPPTNRPKSKPRERRYKFLNLSSRSKINPTGPNIVDALPILEEVSHSQLVYYRDIMCKCHSTLSRCSDLIEANQRTANPIMNQVLRDIKQVCSMLEAAHASPPRSLVELASEATASPLPSPLKPLTSPPKFPEDKDSPPDDEEELNLPPPNSDVDMKTFSCTEGEMCDAFPASYPHVNEREHTP